MPELTDISVIRALCEKYDFALSKGFGQNFIINPGIPTKIVDASGVDKRYGVIEIGPGIGVLTKELAKRAAKVVSIEVDERLPPLLAETMAGVDNFKLVLQDVLKVDLKALIAAEFPGMPVAVCANLPYYITSPIVMKLLGDRLPIESLTVMVQKEAADRLAAVPGTRASSAISCAVNYYATSRLMFTAAPGSFYPAPKVTSAVVRMDIRPTPAVQVEDEEGYFALIRAAFGQRRKTAANAIAGGLNLPKESRPLPDRTANRKPCRLIFSGRAFMLSVIAVAPQTVRSGSAAGSAPVRSGPPAWTGGRSCRHPGSS